MTMRPVLLLSFTIVLLSACAGQDERGYPSLSKRPIEDGLPVDDFASPVETGPVETGPVEVGASSGTEQQLRQTITDLAVKASNGNVLFDLLYDEVAGRIRVAKSAPISSESWVAAQVDLSRLEQARYQSIYALARLDKLYADRLKAIADGEISGSMTDIEDAIAQAQNIVIGQQAKIDALSGVLQQP